MGKSEGTGPPGRSRCGPENRIKTVMQTNAASYSRVPKTSLVNEWVVI